MEYRNGVLKDKSKAFAIRIIKLYQYLSEMKKEYVISKQLLRSGTAIGAMQREAIAQKECSESIYWLELLYETSYLNIEEYNSIYANAEELMKLLTTSIKTAKSHC